MTIKRIGRVLWGRRLILLLAGILGAAAAAPLAVGAEPKYKSSTMALVPAAAPLPNLLPIATQSLIATRLSDFLSNELQREVRASLGAGSEHLTDVTGTQSPDLNTYTLTATATAGDVAEDAATVAAEIVIQEGNRLAEELVDNLNEEVASQLNPIERELTQKNNELQDQQSKLNDLQRRERELNSELSTVRAARTRAEAAGDTENAESFAEEADRLEERLDRVAERSNNKQAKVTGLTSEVTLLRARRQSLLQVTEQAQAAMLSRGTASVVARSAGEASSNKLQSTLALFVAAGLAAMVLASIAVLFLFRKELRLGSEP